MNVLKAPFLVSELIEKAGYKPKPDDLVFEREYFRITSKNPDVFLTGNKSDKFEGHIGYINRFAREDFTHPAWFVQHRQVVLAADVLTFLEQLLPYAKGDGEYGHDLIAESINQLKAARRQS